MDVHFIPDGTFAWQMLPLMTVGKWIEDLLPDASPEAKVILRSFVDWTKCL